jgi:MFS family permease
MPGRSHGQQPDETGAVLLAARPGPFVALRHRDYRLLLSGEFIATLGKQMQTVAISYQVYQLHHSAVELGLLGLVRLIPVLLFSLIGGVIADQVDRRRLLLLTQPALLCCSLALILTTIAGRANIGVIYLITAIAATIGTVDSPTRQALLPGLVPREHLRNALSWDITTAEVATIAGPALGGLAIGAVGIAGTYGFEAASFVAVIIVFACMHARLGAAAVGGPTGWRAAVEGLRFIRGNDIVLAIMSLDFFATFWGSATVLLPVFADKILHVGPTGLGILFSAPAVGSVIGAVVMTGISNRIRAPGLPLLIAVVAFGCATIGFGLARTMLMALLFLAATGLADTVSMTLRHQILQLLTPDALRGRVTAANQVFVQGGPQLGQLEAGAVAAGLGVPFSIISGGVACVLTVILIGWKVPAIRRYRIEQ